MKSHEMRNITPDELTGKVSEWEAELFHARCNATVGQLQNPNVLRTLRRQIARAKTILHEKHDAPGQ
ncbi:MAG: 50S ribosomal protein L29 [Candidatus Lambdaproteobacteria bacterium]|nr:50S ribosomal protein L29 [Candidatus Lambdaproteobacteria bacterium]